MIATISDSVLRAAQKINKLLSEGAEPDGLTPRQIDVLLILSDEPGLSQADMMDRCFMDRSTMSSVMKLMVKKGLVSRRRCPKDVRAFEVELTAKGKSLIRQAKKLRGDVEENIVGTVRSDPRLLSAALLEIAAIPLKDRKRKKK